MKTRDFYENIAENFGSVKNRLLSEEMIERFVLRFAEDKTFAALCSAMNEKDVSEAFRAGHTLKGVAANLGFTALASVSSGLTEILRAGSFDGADAAFIKVKAEYDRIIRAINAAK